MTNGDTPHPQHLILSLVDKLLIIHCANFGVLKHIQSDCASSFTFPPPTIEWLNVDSIVKSWIFLMLAETLQGRLIKANPTTAKDAWEHVEKNLDNKRTRTIALKGELRITQIGDLSVDAYSRKVKLIATLVHDLCSPMSDDDKDPFLNLGTMHSIVTTEEMMLNPKTQTVSTNITSSEPHVLLTKTNHSRGQDSHAPCDNRMNTRPFEPEWNPDVDLLKEDVENVPIWVKLHGVLVTAFSEDGLSDIATKLGTLLMLDSYTSDMCLQSWGRSIYARVMIEIRSDVELKDYIMVVIPKIMGEGPVPKKHTASLSGNRKKGVAHTNEVRNSNPFDVLNLVDNDEELCTNEGTKNLDNNGVNSSGSSFMNVENSSTGNTPIIDKNGKFKDLLIDRQAILVDEAGNPLKKVECAGNYDSESVDNDMARSLASEKNNHMELELEGVGDDDDLTFHPSVAKQGLQGRLEATRPSTLPINVTGRFDVFFCNKLLVFQQHQDESLNDSHLDSLSLHIINLTAKGDLRKFSDIGAWVQVPRCIAWLNYDEHVDGLSTMDNEVGITSPETTIQTLPLFKEYTPPETYPKEVEKTLGTPIEVEPLNETKLEEVGLNCNHNTPLSSREVPSFDKLDPRPQTLPNYNLTIHVPPSSLVASVHLRDLYCYYLPCIDDPKKHYGFKLGVMGPETSLWGLVGQILAAGRSCGSSGLGMDTSWMYLKDKTSSQFTKGVELFLDSIISDVRPGSFKKCPCARCGGHFYNNRDTIKDDLIIGGYMEHYLSWSLMHNFETQQDNNQNEEVTTNIKRDDIVRMVQDAMGIPNVVKSTDVDEGMIDDETKSFPYETWDACLNDCMLFRGNDKFLDSCSICEASRYKKFNNDKQDDDGNLISKRKILAKQERVDDGTMRHPADSPAWKCLIRNIQNLGVKVVMLDLD
nr:hypothetical protein [Tanacetum cinerariifolium]